MKFLLLCLAVSAMAQPQIPADVMTLAVYDALFHTVDAHEQLAAQAEAAGQDPQRRGRKWLQELTGITDQEYARVRPLVLDGIGQMAANLNRAAAIGPKPTATAPATPIMLTAAVRQQLTTLHAQREAMVLNHVKQIQTALGIRFAAFDGAVRAEIGKGLVIQALPAHK